MKRLARRRFLRWSSMLIFGLLLFVVACAEPAEQELGIHRAALRPTAASGIHGYGNAPVKSYLSKGGGFKVWWATSGPHVPDLTDNNGNGIPDIVEIAADTADEVKAFVQKYGFHIALPDDKLFSDPSKNGGDGRFDIYFLDFPAGDGKYNGEACITVGTVRQCGGYLVLENDYANTGYKSIKEAIRIVLPHEYFHAIQSSYKYGMPAWWSEGSATWFEEFFNPAQYDFEHLASLYFREPSRTLSDRQHGPSDGFAYGASIFVYFLSQRFSPQLIRKILEEQAKGADILKALQIVLKREKTTLEKVFEEFAVYNIFTGTRSTKKFGYPDAMRFATVPMKYLGNDRQLNWNVDVDPLAARYGYFEITRPMQVKLASIKTFKPATLVAVSKKEFAQSGKFHIVTADKPAVFMPEDSPIYLAIINGTLMESHAIQVQLRKAKKTVPKEEKSESELNVSDGGTAADASDEMTPPEKAPQETMTEQEAPKGGCACDISSSTSSFSPLFFLLLLFLLPLLRRPSPRHD